MKLSNTKYYSAIFFISPLRFSILRVNTMLRQDAYDLFYTAHEIESMTYSLDADAFLDIDMFQSSLIQAMYA